MFGGGMRVLIYVLGVMMSVKRQGTAMGRAIKWRGIC